ncbi:MAG: methylenetetrahydrofolate reductase, partial [Actinomycetes bacterium]|nr:methylenetetrahydrofolate reductase [Actinomycetes bacterium]
DGLNRATDLVGLIRRVEADARSAGLVDGPVSVGCAVYPHAHGERRFRELVTMRAKQQSGADFAITQVFYDVAEFAALVREAPSAGVSIPILPGIIPLTDPGRLRRLAALSGVEPPATLVALLDVPDPEERFLRGIAATADLVQGALEAGAPGAHVFTFNQARPALALHAELCRRGLVQGPGPAVAGATPASAPPGSAPPGSAPAVTTSSPSPANPTEGHTP